MFKKFIQSVDKKLGKFGIALGLAGVSATAVACYGPPANIEYMRQETLARYAAMCDGGSCETYCKTNECATVANLETEPCDRDHFSVYREYPENELKICNDQWRVERVACNDEPHKDETGNWTCDIVQNKPVEAPVTAEPAQEVPAAEPAQEPVESPKE